MTIGEIATLLVFLNYRSTTSIIIYIQDADTFSYAMYTIILSLDSHCLAFVDKHCINIVTNELEVNIKCLLLYQKYYVSYKCD